jgi:hypothetical protein
MVKATGIFTGAHERALHIKKKDGKNGISNCQNKKQNNVLIAGTR